MNYPWAVPGAKVTLRDVVNFGVRCSSGRLVGTSHFGIHEPVFGVIYTIRDVITARSGEVGILLVEIDNMHVSHKTTSKREVGFAIEHFRPVIERTQEQDVAKFAHLLSQNSIHVSEPESV